MRRDWEPDELIASWPLVDADWRLVGNKSGATRLGFALLLKFCEIDARFPRHAGEVPPAAVTSVAGQVQVPAAAFATDDWSGRTLKYHRAQIRTALGFREAGREDEERLTGWLAEDICPFEVSEERRRQALLSRCRAARVEPPGRSERILGAAQATFEQRFCQQTVARLSAEAITHLEALLTEEAELGLASRGPGRGTRIELKADPGSWASRRSSPRSTNSGGSGRWACPPTSSPVCPRRWSPPGGHAPSPTIPRTSGRLPGRCA